MQSHFLLYIVIVSSLRCIYRNIFLNFINKHCIRDNWAHFWGKYAVFAYLFQCISPN